MAEKMIFCKACGKEIAKSAKMCPHCGKSNKKPFWVTLLIIAGVIIVISAISTFSKGSGSNSTSNSSKERSANTTSVSETGSRTSGNVKQNTPSGPIAITIEDPKDIPFLHNDSRIKAGETYEITVNAWFTQLSGTMLILAMKGDQWTADTFAVTTNSRIPDFERATPVRAVFLYKPGSLVPDQSYMNSQLVSIERR